MKWTIFSDTMKEILQELMDGKISLQEAEKQLKTMQIEEIGDFAKLAQAERQELESLRQFLQKAKKMRIL